LGRRVCRARAPLQTRGALAPRMRSKSQKAPIIANERTKKAPHASKVGTALVSMTSSRVDCLQSRLALICQIVARHRIEDAGFRNLRRPGCTTPCCPGRKPWPRQRRSHHGWNRRPSEIRTHRGACPVEFASTHLRR